MVPIFSDQKCQYLYNSKGLGMENFGVPISWPFVLPFWYICIVPMWPFENFADILVHFFPLVRFAEKNLATLLRSRKMRLYCIFKSGTKVMLLFGAVDSSDLGSML
jgi:hypothetical protein